MSLHLSKYHIVGNHLLRLIFFFAMPVKIGRKFSLIFIFRVQAIYKSDIAIYKYLDIPI